MLFGMTSPAAAPRHPALRGLDIAAGVLLIVFGIVLALGVLTTAIAYGGLHAGCTPALAEGLTCNSTVLGIVVYGLIGVSVLALFLGFGMFIVSIIRKRIAFVWPLGAIVLTIALFYLGTWAAGLTVP